MDSTPTDPAAMLVAAQERARRLVADLTAHQDDLKQTATSARLSISPEVLAEGRKAFSVAAGAAAQLLQNLQAVSNPSPP